VSAGFDTFHPLQREVIENILARRGTLAIMPSAAVNPFATRFLFIYHWQRHQATNPIVLTEQSQKIFLLG
jgi:hypothetical protein